MNFIKTLIVNVIGMIVCMIALAQAGGDKSAKTTVSIGALGGTNTGIDFEPETG